MKTEDECTLIPPGSYHTKIMSLNADTRKATLKITEGEFSGRLVFCPLHLLIPREFWVELESDEDFDEGTTRNVVTRRIFAGERIS